MRPKKVILCADENEQELSTRVFLLETCGYRLLTASNAAETLAILKRAAPGTLDLLLLDSLLPGISLHELARLARRLHPHVSMQIVSAGWDWTAAELLERVKVLTLRKRGPKKRVFMLDGVSE